MKAQLESLQKVLAEILAELKKDKNSTLVEKLGNITIELKGIKEKK